MAESVELGPLMREIGSSVHRLSQDNDLQIDTCLFLARRSALIGYDKDWLAQCQDNVTKWDISLAL